MSAVSPTRSASHYHAPKVLVFQVEQTLYSLPASVLNSRSIAFRGCFSLPNNPGQDGSSDVKPIILHSIKAKEFNAFLDYLFPDTVYRVFTLEELESILKLSNLYMVPLGRDFAIRQIAKLPSISPAQFLRLSCSYRVPEWFKDNFRQLASMPLDEISEDDIGLLGTPLISALVRVRSSIDTLRRNMVHIIGAMLDTINPDIQGNCPHPSRCASAIRSNWREVGEAMFISSSPYHTASSIEDALRATICSDLCHRCGFMFDGAITGFSQENTSLDALTEQTYAAQGHFACDEEDLMMPRVVNPNM